MNRTRSSCLLAILTCCAWGMAPAPARAGGMFVPGFGPQAMGRAGAFVARADDPSALHHNPAGLAKAAGTVLQLGASLLDLSLDYQRAGSYEQAPASDGLAYAGQPYPRVSDQSRPAFGVGPLQAVPLLVASTDLATLGLLEPGGLGGLRLAVGVMAPQAYADRSFAPDYEFEAAGEPPPPQRYDVVSQQALVALPSVAVAYRAFDVVDVGARASWGVARLAASSHVWGVRNYEEWVGYDGVFGLEVRDDFVPAWGAGALYRPAPWLEIGASYASAMHVDGQGTGTVTLGSGLGLGSVREEIVPVDDGDARCAPGGTADALSTCMRLDLPQTASVGVRWVLRDQAGSERGDLEVDVRWEDWSAASDYRIVVDGRTSLLLQRLEDVVVRHGLQDVLSVRAGGSWVVPLGARRVVVRGGLAHDTAAAPASWQRLDIDGAARTTLAAGLAYESGGLRVDLGGGVVLAGERTVSACNPDVANPGCPPGSGDAPVDERTAPDPLQPTREPDEQQQSPFNAGIYTSHYVMLGLGVTARF